MDDWSLLPSRNAESEPAPDHQSTMNTTTPSARLTRPRQAPQPVSITHVRKDGALDPRELAWPTTQPIRGRAPKPLPTTVIMSHRAQSVIPKVKDLDTPLDITRPFMDDIEAFRRLI